MLDPKEKFLLNLNKTIEIANKQITTLSHWSFINFEFIEDNNRRRGLKRCAPKALTYMPFVAYKFI